jgi:hypothetical protein
VRDHCTYDYAVIRLVPQVERAEFINVGVIVSCPDKAFLEARIEVDDERAKALFPGLELPTLRAHLDAFRIVCAGGRAAGPIGRLSQRERFHWLVAPRSTVIQVSPVHSGACRDPQAVIEHLMQTMVRPQRP